MRAVSKFIASFAALIFIGCHGVSAGDQSVGYPFFIASFDEHGDQRRVESDVKHYEVVDAIVTDMFRDCPSRYYIVIKDMTFFDEIDLNVLKKHTKSSMTVASFLTDLPLQMKYLAEDLSRHCKAQLVTLDPRDDDFVPTFPRNDPRVYYIEFDASDEVNKSEALREILKTLHGPRTTFIYQNYFSTDTPVFGDIEVSQQRRDYDKNKRVPRVEPIIGPLDGVSTRPGFPGPIAMPNSTPQVVASEKALKLVIVSSIVLLILLLIRDLVFIKAPPQKSNKTHEISGKPSVETKPDANDQADEEAAVSGAGTSSDIRKRKPRPSE